MTSQDNLRDRIAGVIHERTAFFGGHAYPETLAQAIIAEFGLTVEECIDEPGKRGINHVQRVVGKWGRCD